MARLFAKNFVATHQQIGRFEVVDNHGNLQKNGGNVASCFCTPDGKVIHAVLGPVNAETLLAEADWAMHAAKALTDDAQANGRALVELHREGAQAAAGRNGAQVVKVHRFLETHPLAKWDSIAQEMFTKLLNEKIEPVLSPVSDLSDAFASARSQALPILWILDEARSSNQTLERWRELINRDGGSLSRLAETYAVFALPIDEAPALSRKLKLRPFAAPDRGRPLFVVTRSNGKQLTAVTGWERSSELALAMARGLVQEAKERPRSVDQVQALMLEVKSIDAGLARELGSVGPARRASLKKTSSVKAPSRKAM